MTNIIDFPEYRDGIDYFIDIDERCAVGVKARSCDLIINKQDEGQFLAIKDDTFGLSVSKKEFISLILATGLYEDITSMIESKEVT